MKSVIIVLLLATNLLGCATMSNRTKTILSMVGVGVVAGTVAANLAPPGENPAAHAAIWGGGSAAVTGIAGMFIFNEEKKSEELERKLEVAQKEIATYRGEAEGESSTVIESESGLKRNLPSEYSSLVKPGKWSIYKVNNWVSQGENSFVHQDKILRIDPPQFQPGSLTNKEGENGK